MNLRRRFKYICIISFCFYSFSIPYSSINAHDGEKELISFKTDQSNFSNGLDPLLPILFKKYFIFNVPKANILEDKIGIEYENKICMFFGISEVDIPANCINSNENSKFNELMNQFKFYHDNLIDGYGGLNNTFNWYRRDVYCISKSLVVDQTVIDNVYQQWAQQVRIVCNYVKNYKSPSLGFRAEIYMNDQLNKLKKIQEALEFH